MPGKSFSKAIAMIFGIIIAISFLAFALRWNKKEEVSQVAKQLSLPVISWKKITIEKEPKKFLISLRVPEVAFYTNDSLAEKINEDVDRYIGALKDTFIRGVITAADDNGEASTLNIDTEILLMSPRLISLAFTSSDHLSGGKVGDLERTYLIFDLEKGEMMREGNELFRDDLAWAEAVRIMKPLLLSKYDGEPSCDLMFAPKREAFSASCIGVDYNNEDKGPFSIFGDIPISAIQEFVAPWALKEIFQPGGLDELSTGFPQ
ncbi:hypothetical protein C4572_00870 [Candidatus Parcubacteria bacterium]|nr:MAG: hypothetical protein C4572_00870 [Candidatus Parcubacteria bacterium]